MKKVHAHTHTRHTIDVETSSLNCFIWWFSYIFISWLAIKKSLSFFFFVTLIKLNVLLLQHKVICFALSFMETLGQGGAGTCKSIDFLWHKPTAPCQNNEFLSTPQPPRENVILHAIRAWSVCGQWWGEGSLHLSPRRVGTIFSWAPACYSSTRERTPWINTDGSECGVARK